MSFHGYKLMLKFLKPLIFSDMEFNKITCIELILMLNSIFFGRVLSITRNRLPVTNPGKFFKKDS